MPVTAYALPADLIARKSSQTLGQLVTESGTAVSAANLLSDAVLQAAIDSAAGAVDAALLQAGRYIPSDLQGLSGNSQAYLVHIVCEIAMAYLFARKPTYRTDDYEAQLKIHDLYLERLRRGENIFNIQKVVNAGTPTYEQPSVAITQSLGLMRDRTYNYYPARVSNNRTG